LFLFDIRLETFENITIVLTEAVRIRQPLQQKNTRRVKSGADKAGRCLL